MEEVKPKFSDLRELAEGKAKEEGDRVYIAYYDREITFRDFDKVTSKLANGLKKLGVKKGDIIYILQNNSIDFMICVFGITKLGAIASPLNSWLKAEEIKYQLNDSKGEYIIVESEFIPMLESIKPELRYLRTIIEIGDKAKEVSFNRLIDESSEELEPVDINKDDLAFLFYTGGTTGIPKGVMLTHWNVLFSCESIRATLEREDEVKEEVCVLIFLPLFHVNAMMSLIISLYRGVKVALLKKFSVREFGPTVEKHKCTFFSGVPRVYKILLQAKDVVKKYDLSSLEYGIVGAAPMPPETIREFEKEFGIEVLEGYGLTEGTVASTLHRRGERKIGSIGPALPGQEIKIVDDKSRELPPGQVGHIIVKGENVMVGYLGKEDETCKTIKDGWLWTGDIGYKDEEGYFYIVDRSKDMIIKGGENIYPKEIEDVISQHPKVHDAAVVGVPDEMYGEEVKAFIVPKIGEKITKEEIQELCKNKLADLKVPKYVEFVAGLPATAVGKTLKRLLREGKGIISLEEVERGEELNLDVIFQMIPARFNPQKAGDWKAKIQYEIYGKSGGAWTLVVESGKMEVKKGPVPDPTCKIKMYDQVFKKLVTREIDPITAMNTGLMQMEGNESDVAMLGEVLG